MSGLYDDQMIESLRQGAESLVGEWGLPSETEVKLLTISENATFLAENPETGDRVILRVHRPGYHTHAEIESELAWIADLRGKGVVDTPAPLPTLGGSYLAGFGMNGEHRPVAAFEFMTGSEPAPSEALVDGFRKLGAISARLHAHARAWKRPDAFIRKTWNFETTVGPTPHWGDWRNALGLEKTDLGLLERTCGELQKALAAYGTGPERFGLIHADLRLANLLIEGDRLGVIDFDDCGFGWFVYDFAAAVSFIEHDPILPDLQAAWAEGYRTVANLPEEDEAMLPVFVMLRRLLLTAWIASHSETPTAQEMGPAYSFGTLEIAEQFLSAA